MPGVHINCLQSVLNAVARHAFAACKSDHVTSYLRDLHWLKVWERIQFQQCVLIYCCLYDTVLAYLADALHLVADTDAHRRLLSADALMLLIPSTRRSSPGDRAFPAAAARA